MAVGCRAETAGLEPGQVRSSDACLSDLLLTARPHLIEALEPSQRQCKLKAEHSYHGLESGEDTGNPNGAEVEA